MIETLLNLLRDTLAVKRLVGNDLFSAGLSLSIVGALVYFCRNLPNMIYHALKRALVIELMIDDENPYFHQIEKWVAHLVDKKAIRKLQASNVDRYYDDYDYVHQSKVGLTAGEGTYFVKFKNTWFVIRKVVDEPKEMTRKRKQTYFFYALVFDGYAFFNHVLEQMINFENTDRVDIKVWTNSSFRNIGTRYKRPLSTVFMEEKIKEHIVSDLQKFIESADWYHTHGIPYHRGYFFDGPPGTGKTSLILALASRFERRVNIINLNSVKSDDDLIDAFNCVPNDSFIVLEDIDTILVSRDRTEKDEEEKISLSTLLNVLDGMLCKDGTIVFATANSPELMDKALLRPGRFDIKVTIGLMEKPIAEKMCESFGLPLSVLDKVSFPIAPSELQNILMQELSH